jgi:hypothetical protein
MFSKKLFAGVSLALAAAGCGSIIGEKNPESSMSLQGSDVGCLNGASETFGKYFEGRSSEAQMTALWNCVEKSLRLFSERTRGREDHRYKPEELRSFLQDYFLKNGTQISDGLMFRAMELKSALVGGDTRSLTRPELTRALELITHLRHQTLRLRPLMPITIDGQRLRSEAEVDQIVRIFEEEAHALGAAIQRADRPYAFSSLDGLLAELSGILPPKTVDQMRRQIPLLASLKDILVPTPSAVAPTVSEPAIGADEWPKTLSIHAKLWGFFLKSSSATYRAYYRVTDLRRGSEREKTVELVLDIIGLFEQSARAHADGRIPTQKIEKLVRSIDAKALIEAYQLPLRNFENVEKVIAPGVRRFLGGARLGPDGRDAQGLGLPALAYLRSYVERWDRNQRIIESVEGQQRDSFSAKLSDLSQFSVFDGAKSGSRDRGLLALEHRDSLSLMKYFDRAPVLYAEWSGSPLQITIPSHGLERRGFNDLSNLNLWRELSRMIIAGYADPARAAKLEGLTDQELRTAYEDVRELGIELKAFDPNDPLVPEKRFREASLFMYSADGDELLELEELTELLAFSLSAKSVGDSLHARIADRCYRAGELRRMDTYGMPAIEPRCYFETLYANLEELYPHVPWFMGYVNALQRREPRRFADFRKYFEGSGRKSKDPAWVDSGDSQAMVQLAAYIEALYARFDSDRNALIDQSEAQRALPLFTSSLSKVICTTDLKKVEDAFNFVMKHGDAPDTWRELLFEGIPWKLKDWLGVDPKYQVDRVRILRILYEVSRSASSNQGCN